MKLADDLSLYYAELLEGRYDCVDRIVLNAYFAYGQTGGGLRTWWRKLFGSDAQLDDKHLRQLAGDFARRVRAFCQKHQVPLVFCEAGERKHEKAQELWPEDPKFRGVFAVLVGKAPAPVWEVKRNRKGQITNVQHKKNWPYVQHYYFQILDQQWGHVTIRMCGYPPFGAQVMLNGHEWVERQAARAHIVVAKESNCFVEGSDYGPLEALASRLCQEQVVGRLREVSDRWIYSSCLCFALPLLEQERSGFHYDYSVFQLELSRNLLFRRGSTLDEVYQKLIDRTRNPLDLENLKTIFGTQHRPHHKNSIKRGRREPQVAKEVQAPRYDLTVFKVRWGNLTLKIYDKGGRVLRIEVVVHNAKDLKCGKVIDKLPELLERMKAMLVRFLNTVQAAHRSFLDEGAFEQWTEPTQRGTRRLAGIDLNKARIRQVVDAVVALSTHPDGFTLSRLAEQVRERAGWSVQQYDERKGAYDLAKLRGKGLVRRREKSRRYESDPSAVRTMCAYLVLREKVIKPLLAGAGRKAVGRPPKNISPLDENYLALQTEMQRTFKTLGFAA